MRTDPSKSTRAHAPRKSTTRKRTRTAKPKGESSRRSKRRRNIEPGEPNAWWADLRGFVAADFENRGRLPPLSVHEILAWADAYHARTGEWPMAKSGPIPEAPGETWMAVGAALSQGLRGLPGEETLARLLLYYRGRRHLGLLPSLSIEDVLEWADEYFSRTGHWPNKMSGPIDESPGDNWAAVETALAMGLRGLAGGSSLARLLAEHRGTRRSQRRTQLLIADILLWADAYHGRQGRWPTCRSGAIEQAPGETWLAVNGALRSGSRGLPGGSSLAKLLIDKRAARNRFFAAPLTTAQILAWADAHFVQTGRWPSSVSGAITAATGETWLAIDRALAQGCRGLPRGSSLAKLLDQHRRKSPRPRKPR